MVNFLLSAAGVIVGGFITFLVSKYHYDKATKDLKQTATTLGAYLEGVRKGNNVFLEFNGPGGTLSGQGVIVPAGPIQAKLTLGSLTELTPPAE